MLQNQNRTYRSLLQYLLFPRHLLICTHREKTYVQPPSDRRNSRSTHSSVAKPHHSAHCCLNQYCCLLELNLQAFHFMRNRRTSGGNLVIHKTLFIYNRVLITLAERATQSGHQPQVVHGIQQRCRKWRRTCSGRVSMYAIKR